MCVKIGSMFLSHSSTSKGSVVPSKGHVAYITAQKLAPCAVLDTAHNSPLAIPHMDQLVGVLGPFAVVAAVAEAEIEPVGVVAAEVPRLAVAVWQSLQYCQLAVPARCGEQ